MIGFAPADQVSTEESTEEAEKCVYEPPPHDAVATWYLVAAESCMCSPAKLAICDHCKTTVDAFLHIYGPESWQCAKCGCRSDVIDIRPIIR